ncbi:MAG: riboflavin biosynthesis protein RibF [Thermomicrobiales bacterium]
METDESDRERGLMELDERQLDDIAALASADRVVTIGTFDGVHRGHQLLLTRTRARAQELGLMSLGVTFEPIPAMVLRPDRFPGRLCPAEQKQHLLVDAGIAQVLTLAFDLAFSRQSPESFMSWLAEATGMKELWVGEAFALGRDRIGNVERLREIGRDLGFSVTSLPRLMDDGIIISSSAIRTAIQGGNALLAHHLLGRPFRVAGEVIHGAHLGRTIGFPTANVLPPDDLVQLPDGIYVSCAHVAGEDAPRHAMTYVGTRPTVNTGLRQVETHILDFDGDLYGQTLAVDVLDHIRGDEVFDSLWALIAQLQRDEASTRAFFAASTRTDSN